MLLFVHKHVTISEDTLWDRDPSSLASKGCDQGQQSNKGRKQDWEKRKENTESVGDMTGQL